MARGFLTIPEPVPGIPGSQIDLTHCPARQDQKVPRYPCRLHFVIKQ